MNRNFDPPSMDDLRTGRRARVTEKELEKLSGVSRFTLQRNRRIGKGLPFCRDENGRVWYLAADVIASIDQKKHRSTVEYDTSQKTAQMLAAREAREARAR